VISRVRAAEHAAACQATGPGSAAGSRAALVLADRAQVIRREAERAYPLTRTARVTYSGSGYQDGYAKGQRADIGTSRLTRERGRALTGASR
jgi:hypothetical protein